MAKAERRNAIVPTVTEELAIQLNKKYSAITVDKLKKFKVDPRSNIAGLGFIRREQGTLMTGSTGIGKSVLVLQVAMYLASGRDIFDRIHVPHKNKVLVINSQNDMQTLKQDVESISHFTGIKLKDIQDNLDIRYIPSLPSEEFFTFLEYVLKKTKPDVVMIDPYQDFIGAVEIKDSKPFFQWRDSIEPLMKEYKFALVTTPHTPKPQERSGWSDQDMVYMAIGTSALPNWCRVSCELLHEKEDVTKYKLHFSKNPARTGMMNESGDVVKSLYVEHCGTELEPCWKVSALQGGALKINEEALIKDIAWSNPSWSYREIGAATGIRKNKVMKYYPDKLKNMKKKEEKK